MDNKLPEKKQLTQQELDQCISVLEHLLENGDQLTILSEEKRIALMKAAGQISRPDRAEIKKRNHGVKIVKKKEKVENDRIVRANTGIRSARIATVFEAPQQFVLDKTADKEKKVLDSPRNCYVCKDLYTEVHHFYDAMCPKCADFNYAKRFQTCDLTGKVALITGSRLKIGYQATLMMLRAGATVIATTRFPVDSANRFAKEADFADWGHRLKIHGLDLRHIPSVEIFANYILQTYDRLDILINNAAQTVRRPPGFYAHLMNDENLTFEHHNQNVRQLLQNHQNCINVLRPYMHLGHDTDSSIPVTWHGQEPGMGIVASAKLSQIPYNIDNSIVAEEVFPQGKLDADLQQVDLRKVNSWRLKLGDIETPEMIEVQLVNAIAPFVLSNKLVNLMKKDFTGQKHIVNVSAMEGKFYRFVKESRHPHTNMAKAALNMLTHTSAGDLAQFGIYTNAVDTGWVTDEDPVDLAKFKQEYHDFQPPLDIVDGAARVCDPFIDGILTGKHWNGKFLKDYFPIDW
jgi:NAD(P)-dependent dehydrogenase (short-subunit alcohol dehydrogenase family)